MAPRLLPQSWSSPFPPTIAQHHVHSRKVGHLPPNHSTLQWHPAMAPRALPQSWSSPSPPMTPCNGTPQRHHVHSAKVGRHPPRQPYHTTMAPYDRTQQWHHVHCTCNGTLVPRPIPHSGSPPSPPLEVRTAIAIAIWGEKNGLKCQFHTTSSTAPSLHDPRFAYLLAICINF